MAYIDDYLENLEPAQKAALETIRTIIHQVAPDVEEGESYGMPGFKHKGKYLGGFAAFKDHLSFFPTSEPVEALKDQLDGFKLSKGTIQFTVERPIPQTVLRELVQVRVRAIDA